MKSVWFYVVQQFAGRGRDLFDFVMDRLPEFVLVLLAVAAPVGFTVFHETATAKPPDPNHYCVRLIAGDGQAGWAGPFCFAADFAAQWYRNLVEFPASITADCQVVGDEREKQACADDKERIVGHFNAAVGAAFVGYYLGSMRR